jgi:hypothetical protein
VIIKDGTVEYTRTLKDGVARVVLTLDVEENDPGAAIAWANELLGAWSTEAVRKAEPFVVTPAGWIRPEAEIEEILRAKEAAAAPQENPTASHATPTSGTATAPSGVATTSDAVGSFNPFAIGAPAKEVPEVNPTVAPDIPATTPETSPAPSLPPSDENSEPVSTTATSDQVELTDNDLHALAHRLVESKVPATKIKAITAKYADGSMSIRSIPAEKRHAWLAEVKGLKAA